MQARSLNSRRQISQRVDIHCQKFKTSRSLKHKPPSTPPISLTNSCLSPKFTISQHTYLNLCFTLAPFVLLISTGKVLNLRNSLAPQFMPGVIWKVQVRKFLQQHWHQLLILCNCHWKIQKQICILLAHENQTYKTNSCHYWCFVKVFLCKQLIHNIPCAYEHMLRWY